MIAVRRDLVFALLYGGYTVLVEQFAHKAMPHVHANLLEFLDHSWSTIAGQTETRLFFDMPQGNQIRLLPATGWAAAERP